ncbi:MAG: glycosyltransferase family 2 protein [Gammaproteobacteria bacterium]
METAAPTNVVDIVIPAYNEEGNIARAIETLFERLQALPYRFELIVVDDGSHDRTAEIAASYAGRYPVRVVRLTRNFGKENALLAGLDLACGAATILMDADLQHPVELIPEFLARWEQGFEVVYAVKESRQGETLLKRLATAAFYAGVNRGADVDIPTNAVDFRLLDRAAVRALCSIRERVRFTKGLYAWLGFRTAEVPFVAAERHTGKTTFNRGRLVRLGWDGLTSFSDFPLRVASTIGALVAFAAVPYGLWIAVRTLAYGVDVPGWATLTVAVMLLSGVQLLFLGVLGQYIRNVFIETKQRPNYLIRDIIDADSAAASQPGVNRESQPTAAVAMVRSGRSAAV